MADFGFERDSLWRPVNLEVDRIEEPMQWVDYGSTYRSDPTSYYYWRSPRRG